MVYVITTAMEGILRATGVRKNLHPFPGTAGTAARPYATSSALWLARLSSD